MSDPKDPLERVSGILDELSESGGAAAGDEASEVQASSHRFRLPTDTGKFETLYQVTQAITSLLDPEELREKVLDLLLEAIEADRGTIFLMDADTGDLVPRVSRNVDRPTLADATSYSHNILKTMGGDLSVILSFDTRGDTRFNKFQSVAELEIRSFMCVPIRHHDKVLGTIYVDSRGGGKRFTEDDLNFLLAFTNVAGNALHNAAAHQGVLRENQALKEEVSDRFVFGNLIASSASMQPVMDLLRRILDSDVTILVTGETGTGKEVIAKAIHYNGRRRSEPFVAINCAAMPETLVESELFGHRRGAFTDAREDKKGLFEAAGGGTIFLDEVGELSPAVQAKLLRVVQEGEVLRIGENEPRKVDVRVLSATNRDLEEEVKVGNFREDLYYRLNVVVVNLPPLRERREDIPLLAAHFVEKYSKRYKKAPPGFDPSVIQLLGEHDWPGNVRELENEIERAVALSRPDEQIEIDLLSAKLAARGATRAVTRAGSAMVLLPGGDQPLQVEGFGDERELKSRIDALEKALIVHELALHNGNKTSTAKTLGLSRAGLNKKLTKYGLLGGS